MKIITSTSEIQKYCMEKRVEGKTIGIVPTMGFFHEGHLSLMRQAREENDVVVTSIFVNPTQFGPSEDYEAYPRDLERDSEMARKIGVDVIFSPQVKDMYPTGYATFVNVEGITDKMCGASRPTHFRGVTTVVTKLFNLMIPQRAYFGQKDAQQSIVIKRMNQDLNFGIDIVVLPIVREADGLAMSSRNKYLSEDERKAALQLNKSLLKAKELIQSGEHNPQKVHDKIKSMLEPEPLLRI
ncbi:pantoate--beta-alanine ligase, partial [Candidatus Poribacteria bacterium]|nr:pantoate--beta-alanine ligase [Candidatus Poribacteria bacterium]